VSKPPDDSPVKTEPLPSNQIKVETEDDGIPSTLLVANLLSFLAVISLIMPVPYQTANQPNPDHSMEVNHAETGANPDHSMEVNHAETGDVNGDAGNRNKRRRIRELVNDKAQSNPSSSASIASNSTSSSSSENQLLVPPDQQHSFPCLKCHR